MAVITVQTVTGGQIQLYAADSNGDRVPNDGDVVIIIQNQSGSNRSATFIGQRHYPHPDNPDPHDRSITVSGGDIWFSQKHPTFYFNNAAGQIEVTYSDNANNIYIGAVLFPTGKGLNP
jgi:hypothetical protein